jgi:hypothetical protein
VGDRTGIEETGELLVTNGHIVCKTLITESTGTLKVFLQKLVAELLSTALRHILAKRNHTGRSFPNIIQPGPSNGYGCHPTAHELLLFIMWRNLGHNYYF